MAQNTYKPTIERIIGKYEGGYGWDKADTGGPTKYGITCYDLAEHMGQKMNSMASWAPVVQAMTLQTAEDIYATKYAGNLRYNDLPAGPDACMLDYGINSGWPRPIRVARAILSIPGKATMDQPLVDAIRKTDPAKFIDRMCDERLSFMHAIRGGAAWKEFGGGWGKRVADLRTYSDHLISPTTTVAPDAPDLTKVTTPKAQHGDPKIITKTVTGTVSTTVAGGGGGWLSGVPHELLAVGLGFVIVGGVAYVLYHQQKAAAANATVILPPVSTPLVAAAA